MRASFGARAALFGILFLAGAAGWAATTYLYWTGAGVTPIGTTPGIGLPPEFRLQAIPPTLARLQAILQFPLPPTRLLRDLNFYPAFPDSTTMGSITINLNGFILGDSAMWLNFGEGGVLPAGQHPVCGKGRKLGTIAMGGYLFIPPCRFSGSSLMGSRGAIPI